MEAAIEQRARKLVKQLNGDKHYSGFLVMGGLVVLRSSGAPYTDTPTMFDEADFKNAIDLGLLEKRKVTGSVEWEWYTLK